MAGSDLVENYKELVDRYDLLRQRIQKANEQRERFKNTVVAKVLADYERQAEELEAELVPCEARMYRLVSGLEAEQARVGATRTELEEQREEIELRNLIGEFEDGEYELRSSELKAGLESVTLRLAALQEELESYRELMARAGAEQRKEAAMALVQDEAGGAEARENTPVSPVAARVAALEPAPVPVPPAAGSDVRAAVPSRPEVPVASSEPLAPPPPTVEQIVPPAVATSTPPMDMDTPFEDRPVFEDRPLDREAEPLWGGRSGAVVEPTLATGMGTSAFDDGFGSAPVGGESGGGGFEMILDDLPMSGGAGLDQGLPPFGGGGMDDLQGLTELDNQWQKDLADDFPPSSALHDVLLDPGPSGMLNDQDFPNIGFGVQDTDLPPLGLGGGTAVRAAFLIRREGRPDEDRYEIRDDVTSIGRGRDNQIQIKDDTKVSRYHCRVLREPGGYFIEDNNSSNGTMVNGELITRRQIDGGEELTIGETAFRFLVA